MEEKLLVVFLKFLIMKIIMNKLEKVEKISNQLNALRKAQLNN
jgi:hypothetical protein